MRHISPIFILNEILRFLIFVLILLINILFIFFSSSDAEGDSWTHMNRLSLILPYSGIPTLHLSSQKLDEAENKQKQPI